MNHIHIERQRWHVARWYWSVDLGAGASVAGWTLTRRGARRAASREWGLRRP